MSSGLFVNLGQSALHIAAAEAAGANIHPPGSSVHHNANALHIGSPDTMALAVGMADVVAVQRALFANLTILTHRNPPPYWSVTHQAYLQYHKGEENASIFLIPSSKAAGDGRESLLFYIKCPSGDKTAVDA